MGVETECPYKFWKALEMNFVPGYYEQIGYEKGQ
jgi:hypothetical protein